MALSIKTNRMLWGRSASRCALPECRRELVIDPIDTDDPSLVGEAAHIVAEQLDGPRGQSDLPPDKRNKYANLILLCNVHHKQIDDQVEYFTVERLKSIKIDHEGWVRTSLSAFDAAKQEDDERWAAYIEEWTSMLDLKKWRERTYPLLQATPYVQKTFFRRLIKISDWTISRVWPTQYPEIREALTNFGRVANDFVNVFQEHSKDDDNQNLWTERSYKIREWDPERYDLLSQRFEFHVDLIHDLTCEMTRAANYVCDNVREHLDGSFRISEGVLLVTRGMGMDLKEHTYRLEYRLEERTEQPYKGLDEFLHDRGSRDFYIGTGDK